MILRAPSSPLKKRRGGSLFAAGISQRYDQGIPPELLLAYLNASIPAAGASPRTPRRLRRLPWLCLSGPRCAFRSGSKGAAPLRCARSPSACAPGSATDLAGLRLDLD